MGRAAVGSHAIPTVFFLATLCILLLPQNALSFYLPGVAPEDFQKVSYFFWLDFFPFDLGFFYTYCLYDPVNMKGMFIA